MHVNASTQKAIFDYYAERSGVAHDNASAATEWHLIGGIPQMDLGDFKSLVREFEISDDDANILYNSLWDNYQFANKTNVVDISHLFAIMAVYLSPDELIGSGVMKILNVDSDKITTGFGGDIFGVVSPTKEFFIAPSIGNDDYMADLDAVNIYRILTVNKNISITDAIISYYEGIRNRHNSTSMLFKEKILNGKQTWN